jgi:hypothetical protein
MTGPSNPTHGSDPLVCPICRRRFPTARAKAAHTCQLGEKFFRDAIPRWRAAGVVVLVNPTNYGGQAPEQNGR